MNDAHDVNGDLPSTERAHPHSAGLDLLATDALVAVLIDDHRVVVDAVRAQAQALARIADEVAMRLRRGGRLHYVGAGTSGRLGALDAAEMPPTFGVSPDLVCAHIAGGERALTHAVEGAEDDEVAGEVTMRKCVRTGDAVIGISASGGAPYVVRALTVARDLGALTVALVNVDDTPLAAVCEHALVVRTGPEVISGSTRLKAGSAQKLALNTLSTAVMVRLGRVYDNVMVDLVATNRKLRNRAERLVRSLAHVDAARAAALLDAAGGSVKVAVVMERAHLDAAVARARLAQHQDNLRDALRDA